MSSESGKHKRKVPDREESKASLHHLQGTKDQSASPVSSSMVSERLFSFLQLKEALVLRQVHRQFNEARNDLYQFSFHMNFNVLKMQGFIDRCIIYKYRRRNKDKNSVALLIIKICERCSVMRLCVLFLEEYLIIMYDLIEHSKTDNSQAADKRS